MNPLQLGRQRPPDAISAPTPAAALPPAVVKVPQPPPVCHGTGCTEQPLVQWRRRLTPAELEQELALERQRRSSRFELRDVQKPPPAEGPMPTTSDFVRAVQACGDHAITIDAAALVHASNCAGPDSATLPECGCTPEPAPEPTPIIAQPLPAHWTAPPAGST